MMFFYENAGSQVVSWFFFISCVVLCNFFILNLTVGQMMIRYNIEMDENDKVKKENDQYDIFSQELIDLGKKVLPEEFCQENDKNLNEFIIDRDDVFLSEKAKDFVQIEKSFIASFAEAQK